MTITTTPTTTTSTTTSTTATDGTLEQLPVVIEDLYRDVHKGIRAELFGVTSDAGHLDPANAIGREALARRVGRLADLLVMHAEHEDTYIGPVLDEHMRVVGKAVASVHREIEEQLFRVRDAAFAAVDAPASRQAAQVHHLYLDLARFTATYLEHEEVEERVLMPALEKAVGVEACMEIHHAIVSNIPPEEMATWLSIMLPAMNVDERCNLLGGVRAGAPVEVFAGTWALAQSVLTDRDAAALAVRLGL